MRGGIQMLFGKKRVTVTPDCDAVVVAAGNATRMGGIDKALALIGLEPVLVHAVRPFQQSARIRRIVVVTREDLLVSVSEALHAAALEKVAAVIVGGQTRTESVIRGLDALDGGVRLVAVHDGARPLITAELVDAVVEKAAKTGAAAPAVPVKDTIKVAEHGVVTRTPDRATLFAVQTPQVFDRDFLRGALQKAKQDQAALTDECMACERLGMKVHLVAGAEENLKITTPIDLIVAGEIMAGRDEI